MTNSKIKFAVLSHVLPPSSSGQAIMLFRLLQGLPVDQYCLLSREDYGSSAVDQSGSKRLSVRYYHLHDSQGLSWTRHFPFSRPWPNLLITFWPKLFKRSREIEMVLRQEKPQSVLACSGDLHDIPAAYLACKRCGVKFIPYMFDDYAFQWTGPARILAKMISNKIIKKATRVIVPNEFLARDYRKRYGVKATIVRNPCSHADFDRHSILKTLFPEDEVTIVYSGAVYHANNSSIKNLISAINRLRKYNIKLHIYTNQSKAVLKSAGIKGDRVIFHSHVDQSQMPIIQSQADILFLPLAFNSSIHEVITTSAPGKMGEYLARGKPILVHAPNDAFISWYFNRNHCGLVVDQDNINALAKGLEKIISDDKLRKDLAKTARKQADRDFNLTKITKIFTDLVYGRKL